MQIAEERLSLALGDITDAPAPPPSVVSLPRVTLAPPPPPPPPPPPSVSSPLSATDASAGSASLSGGGGGSGGIGGAASLDLLEQQAVRWRAVVDEVRARQALVTGALERRIAASLEAERDARRIAEDLLEALLDARIRMASAGLEPGGTCRAQRTR